MQNFSISYRRDGHEVAVLAWRDDGPRREKLEREGIQVILGGTALEQGLRAAEDFDPDVIHIHRVGVANPTETTILRRLRTPRRRVLETNVFGRVDESEGADYIDVHMHLGAWALWRWRRWAGRGGRDRVGIIVPNPVTRHDFARASGADIRNFRHRLGIPDDAFVCGRIGQPNRPSWHPATLNAFRHVAEQDPEARLLLIGLPDCLQPMRRRLPSSIARRIITLPLTDADNELSLIYSSLDCFLHAAAIGESFGYVLTEAMLCECPVVTASTPHVSNTQVEVVGHLVGGVVAGSLRQLPDATAFLWSQRDLTARLAPNMREHVLSRFDADVVARQALKVAELALESPDRATLRERIARSGVRDSVDDNEIETLMRHTHGGPSAFDLLEQRLRHSVLVRRAVDLRFRRKLQAIARRHESARLDVQKSDARPRGGDGFQRGRRPGAGQAGQADRIRGPSPQVTVSAVMPTYNAAPYLRAAIDSVLAQTFTDWELIVVDDGSQDETPEILAGFDDPRIKMRRLAVHSGRAAARNAGLDLVTGRYVAMCDSDDISLPHRFATQVAFLDAHPGIDVLSGHMMIFDERSTPRRATTYPEESAQIHRRFRKGKMGVVHAASMLRVRCFTAFGRYREELERAEDFEFLRRIHPFCVFHNLPEVLLLYRHEVTRTPWWKWLETRRYHRYAHYLSDANGSTSGPVMGFEAFSRRWRHDLTNYTIELVKFLKFNAISWIRDMQARRTCASPVPRIALLTNFIPPYRVSLLEALQSRVGQLRIFVSTPIEANRNWSAAWGDLDVVVQRTLTLRGRWSDPSGFRERTFVHIPFDTVRQLWRFRPDVVISGELGLRTCMAALYRLLRRRTRLVIWATLSERTERGRGIMRSLIRPWLLGRADRVLVNGSSGARYVAGLGVPDDRIRIVPYSVDAGAFQGDAAPRRFDQTQPLLFVGQLVERKGLLSFLEGLNRWAARHPSHAVELWLAGEGPQKPLLERAEMHPRVVIRFLGNVAYDALPALYAQARMLVMPTLADEWGVVVNEAMSAGLPVLGSVYSQAVEELVEDGRSGWTFAPDQPETLDAALARALVASSADLERLGDAARRRAGSLTPERVADRMVEAIVSREAVFTITNGDREAVSRVSTAEAPTLR